MAIPVMEKTTLGDIEELAALKEKLDNQKVAAFKKEASAKAKAEVEEEPKTAAEADTKSEE
jgi:small subunit ribosomal protein S1